MPYLSLEVLQYHRITEAVLQKDASSMDVVKVHEEQRACALAMVGDKDARSPHATKVQKAEQRTAKHMEEGNGVNTLGARKAPRGRPITAYRMAVGNGAGSLEGVGKPHVGNRAFALSMVVGRGVR